VTELSTAVISDDELYRYSLTRRWDEGKLLCWIMLNPSTADAMRDDPTIRRVRGFTKREGYPGFAVVNLFALRVTRPIHLLDHPDPVGPDNDVTIRNHVEHAANVVIAWGANGSLFHRDEAVLRMIDSSLEWSPLCLGHTGKAQPRHPLYVAGNQPFLFYDSLTKPDPIDDATGQGRR
jgi:hypothetical protein